MVSLTDQAKKVIDGKNFANVATLMRDGSPQVTPVWIDRDGELVLFNTAEGRVKHWNLRRDPHVALSIYDQNNPYEHVTIRGRVVEMTNTGADEHIDRLSLKYTGRKFTHRPGEKRVIIKIKPERIS